MFCNSTEFQVKI